MKVRRLFSVSLSIVVVIVQLALPLGRALASLPETTEGIPQPRPSPGLPASYDEPIVIPVAPVADDEPTARTSTPARPPTPPRTLTSPLGPLAPQEGITVPLGTGNNNYGQPLRDTDNPQNHPGHHHAGPVNLANGNLFLTAGDFFIPGLGLSLQLARSYNSLAAANGEVGTFGYGWTHSYETHVISETGGITVTVVDGDGALHDYHSPQPCPDTPVYTCYQSPPGFYRQLRYMPGAGYMLLYKNSTIQLFDLVGQLVEITDRDANQINLYYYPSLFCDPGFTGPPNTLCRVDDTSGQRSLLFGYALTSGLIEVVQEWFYIVPGGVPGRLISYGYDVESNLISVAYPEGPANYEYAEPTNHLMTGYNDPRQPEGVRQAEQIAYDGQNRVISITFDVDSFFDITYDLPPGMAEPGQIAVEITDSEGQQSRVEFDEYANVVYEGDWFPDLGFWIGKWWWWWPWRWWLLWRKVDANYHVTSYAYDDWGNTTVVTNALGATQHFLWEEPYYETFGTGIDSYGNILSAANSAGVSTLYKYDYVANVMTETQAAGTPDERITDYETDGRGQLIRQTNIATLQTTEYAYDEFGNTRVITDARGNTTYNDFDPVGRPVATTDQAGKTTFYIYDDADRLLSVTDPEDGTTYYTYSPDGRDNLVQLVNANGVTTTFEYDALDRLITQINSLNQTTAYQYDGLGRLIQRTDADGRVTHYEYDAKSRMTKAEYYAAGASEPYQINTYSYDPAGNLIQTENEYVRLTYEYDPLDQRTRIDMWTPTWGATRALQLERDSEAGNLTRVIGSGGYQVEYEYDPLNRLQTVRDVAGTTVYSTTYKYDEAGRLGSTVYPDGTTAGCLYNETNHPTQLEYAVSGGEIVSYTYDYDERGNIVGEVDEGKIYTYTYDDVGRVLTTTTESQGASPYETSYEYDPVGNRLSARGTVSETFEYDAHNRLLQASGVTFEYNEMGARTGAQMGTSAVAMSRSQGATFGSMDVAGGMQAAASTVSYQYDNDMRLTHVDPGLTFLYDPLGNLIGTIDSEGHYRYFLRDGEDIYMELDENGDVVAQYTVGGQGVLSMWRDGQRYLFLYDGRGRVRQVIDLATGDVVIQYGTDLNDPGTGPYYLYNPIRIRGAWWFPDVRLVLFGGGVFWDPWFGVFLVKAWPWIHWPFGPFHPWRPIFRFWPWPWPWPRPWGWPWPRPWPFLWPWPGAWVRPWVIWPIWPWALRPWWPWWYWRWWWGWSWWGHWWCWRPWWWWCKWWWWPWWHPWWWWGYWWFPWWWWWSCWWWPWYWWWWYWWWWPWWWPGWFFWCWWWWWPWHWWYWPWWWPPILGPPEVGDAPDPPYSSYRLNRGAVHGIWWYEWLGAWRDGEWDSDQVDADWYDDGVQVDLVAGTLTFTPTVAYPWSARYGSWGQLNVHGWFDWNGDNDWDDAGEFVVNWSGYPGGGTWPAGQSSFGVAQPFVIPSTVFASGDVADLWARFRLDYAANWESPRDYTRFGEVEDHMFTVVRPSPPPWNGQLIGSLYAPLAVTYTKIVSGISVSITPTAVITPTWSGGPTLRAARSVQAGKYGNQATIYHEPFASGETYTISLSSGVTYTGTEVVLPASFSFTTPIALSNVTIQGETSGAPGIYTFTTSYEPVTATTPITYTWDNGDTISTSVRSLGAGVHTLVVTATNPSAVVVTDTHTITITAVPTCTQVTGVDLTVATTGSLYIDDVIYFNADVAPDDATKPYTYRITYDGTPGTALTSSADPLIFTNTFPITGPHTVGIGVWNCAMTETQAMTDTVTFTVYAPRKYIYLPLVVRNS